MSCSRLAIYWTGELDPGRFLPGFFIDSTFLLITGSGEKETRTAAESAAKAF